MPTVLESLNAGLHRAMKADSSVYLIGEDVLDPYGGAFKVTRGLSSAYPDRVLSSPISEAGITGLAAGMAMRGLRPVVEIMFGDFLTLAADQIINHAAKFRWMYNDQVRVPLVIRAPMGGRRGYGPTHSQTIEKHFLGTPGLEVVAPTFLGNPGRLLEEAILETEDPLLFVENKRLYLLPVEGEINLPDFDISATGESTPTWTLKVRGAPAAQLTIAAYGYMGWIASRAVIKLAFEHEIFCELVIPTQLAPTRLEEVQRSAAATGRLLTIEEGGLSFGWGAEAAAQTAEHLGRRLEAVGRLAAKELPIPASGPLETACLPGEAEIVQAAKSLVVARKASTSH